jgi:hypothetical protein
MDFYIGRGAPLGNPYTNLGNRQTLAKYITNTKQDALRRYKDYLLTQLMDKNSPQYLEFRRLVKFASKHDIYLVCHCAPSACEGDFIKQLIENLLFTADGDNDTTRSEET